MLQNLKKMKKMRMYPALQSLPAGKCNRKEVLKNQNQFDTDNEDICHGGMTIVQIIGLFVTFAVNVFTSIVPV